jgi:hypothetical protein
MKPQRAATRLLLMLAALAGPSRAIEAPASLQHSLATARTGDIVDISAFSTNVPTLPKVNVTRTWSGGTLVFSDSPEYVPGPGILYADTLGIGPARFFVYHVNDSANSGTRKQDLKFTIIVEPANPGETPTLTLNRAIVYGASTDYGYVGLHAAYDFLSAQNTPSSRVITGPTVLDPGLEARVVPGQAYPSLIEALYDVEVSGAGLKFTIAAIAKGVNSLATYGALAPLAREQSSPGVYKHDRGTYPNNADKTIAMASGSYSTASGLAHIRVGGGAGDPNGADAYAGQGTPAGYDAMLGIPSFVLGNYGVLYRFAIPASSPDGRRVAVLMNPRGGASAAAVRTGPCLTGEGTFYAPAGGAFLTLTTQATVMGRWNPGVTPTIAYAWSPPGSTSLPVEFILVPYPESGDVNANGEVDLRDAAMAMRFAAGKAAPTAKQLVAADVIPAALPDGLVTFADVAWIVRQCGGLQ